MKDYLNQLNQVKNKKTTEKTRLIKHGDELKKAIAYLSGKDKKIAEIIKLVGPCRLKPHKKYFETLIDAIVSQQLSLRAAETIFNRFKLLFSENGRAFPAPEQIIALDDAKLRACGLSNAKVKYVKDLSSKVLNGTIKIHKLESLTDEEIINELVQVKGIGVWTAHMFLIFCLARLNVLPVGDLGFKNAVMKNYRLKKFPNEKKVESISKKYLWHPYRSVAAWYHWQSLSINKTDKKT
jgi:DNA-3-methyladenine glycosylase II